MRLKDILKGLKQEERDQLKYAFENSICQLVEFQPGIFIGVYVGSDFEIIEQAGEWYVCRKQK